MNHKLEKWEEDFDKRFDGRESSLHLALELWYEDEPSLMEDVVTELKSFISQQIEAARAERTKEVLKIIEKSRTVDEHLGVGMKEATARAQVVIDILQAFRVTSE